MADKKYFLDTAILNFDLNKASNLLKDIFNDDLARTLWLAIKQGHIVDQYFDENCLKYSKYFKENGIPESDEKLSIILVRCMGGGPFDARDLDLARRIRPYLEGREKLEYKTNPKFISH